jgi:hypothetical protein
MKAMIKITKENAVEIAQQSIDAKIALSAKRQERRYDPVHLYLEDKNVWIFFAACPELIDKGVAPGGLFAHVDKRDGHLWNDEEIEQFWSSSKTPVAVQQDIAA